MIPLLLALTMLLSPFPRPALPGAPGLDGAGSVRVLWTQQQPANVVVAAVVRADGTRQALFVAELPDTRTSPYQLLPLWPRGKAWPIYIGAWAPGDQVIVSEEVREGGRYRRGAEYGPLPVVFAVRLPVVAQ